MDFKDNPEFFENQMAPNKQKADQIHKDPKKIQLDDSFILLAFLKKQKNKYSYERLKHEMSTVNPEIREVPLEEFKNTLKFAFTKLKSNQNSQSRNPINSLDDYKEITNQMADYLNTDPSTTKNSVLPGIEQMKGIWNNIETQHLIYVLMKKSYQKKIFFENGSINWEKVSHYVPGRSPKCCYDKYKQLLKCKQIDKIENIFSIEDSDVKFNKLIQKAFTPQQETELLDIILSRIENGELVTIIDVSILALKLFYSPVYLAIKAMIFSSLENHIWPFDEEGNALINENDAFFNKLLNEASHNSEELLKKYGIKQFKASLSWCYKFVHRNGLSFKKVHFERRGSLKPEEVEQFLIALADAIATYGSSRVLNMDETSIKSYNNNLKALSKVGVDTVKRVFDHYNEKECTTYIWTISKNENLKLPLVLLAKGKTETCEEKHKCEKSEDKYLHSTNGWTTTDVMLKYIKWLWEQMGKKPFALVLDVFRAHKHPNVLKLAKKLQIELIFIPSCGTGIYQPLDRKIFGVKK